MASKPILPFKWETCLFSYQTHVEPTLELVNWISLTPFLFIPSFYVQLPFVKALVLSPLTLTILRASQAVWISSIILYCSHYTAAKSFVPEEKFGHFTHMLCCLQWISMKCLIKVQLSKWCLSPIILSRYNCYLFCVPKKYCIILVYIYLTEMLYKVNDILPVRHLAQCLANYNLPIKIDCYYCQKYSMVVKRVPFQARLFRFKFIK